MGKGLIVSGGAAGLYQVELTLDRTRADQRTAELATEIPQITTELNQAELALTQAQSAFDQAVADQDAAIAAFNAGGEYATVRAASVAVAEAAVPLGEARFRRNGLQLRLASAEKEQDNLSTQYPTDPTVSAWCADYVEDLAGVVGTIEIPGERAGVDVIIRPGWDDQAAHDSARDGQLQPSRGSTPEGTYYNLAMLPGWQKWKPTYRLGQITAIDEPGNTADVLLDPADSSQQALDVNQTTTLSAVPIDYMDCDVEAFAVNDRVVVQYLGQDWTQPTIIGFETNPRECTIIPGLKSSVESDTEALPRHTYTWNDPNWTAVRNGGQAQRQTWRNLDGSVVLSWNGPENGLWTTGGDVLQGGSTNDWEDQIFASYSNDIYSEGRRVAILNGGGVSGACIQDRGAVIRLWAIANSGASLDLKFADLPAPLEWPTVPIQGDYDALTNPTGWQLAQNWLLPTANGEVPAQMWQCNASGTEAATTRIERQNDTLFVGSLINNNNAVRLANLARRKILNLTFDPPNLIDNGLQQLPPLFTPYTDIQEAIEEQFVFRCDDVPGGTYREYLRLIARHTSEHGTDGFFSEPEYELDTALFAGQMTVGVFFEADTLREIEVDVHMTNYYDSVFNNVVTFGWREYFISDDTPVPGGTGLVSRGWVDETITFGDCNFTWTEFPIMVLTETRELERRATWRIKGGADLWTWTGDETRVRTYEGVRRNGFPFYPVMWENPLAHPNIPDPNPVKVGPDSTTYLTAATIMHWVDAVSRTVVQSIIDQIGIDPLGSNRIAKITAAGSDEYSQTTADVTRGEVNFFGIPVQRDLVAHTSASGQRNRDDKPFCSVEFGYDPGAPFAHYLEDGDPVALTGLTGPNPRFLDIRLV